jgi:tripeptidyl-peptidase-1
MGLKIKLFVFLSLVAVALSTRVVLESTARPHVSIEWTKVGDADPRALIDLSFPLKQRNIAAFEARVESLSDPSSYEYGKYMTVEQIRQMISPPKSAVAIVTEWLQQHGVTQIEDLSDWVRATMTVEQAEKLLQVDYHHYRHIIKNVELIRAPQHYTVPQHVADVIDFVGGVFRFPKVPKPVFQWPGQPITPATILQLYNASSLPAYSANLQTVVSFLGQYFDPADLKAFQANNNLPTNPIEQIIGPNDPTNPGVEASLDVDFLVGIPGNIRTWVWSTAGQRPFGNEPFLDFLMNVSATATVPYVFSISYQDFENTVTPEYATRVSVEFMKGNARGLTFVTGSGDWGVGCTNSPDAELQVNCNIFTADFPSSSPYLTSLGATYLTSSGTEKAVSFSSGGFSNYFNRPSWQKDAVAKYMSGPNVPPTSFFNTTGRGFPDLATVGTNFQVVIGGSTEPVSGTSAATPTFASLISMFNTLRLARKLPVVGNINAFLYKAWAINPNAFTDIVQGDQQDQGCCAANFATVPGWDPYTGLGTPNWGILADLLLSNKVFVNFPAPSEMQQPEYN